MQWGWGLWLGSGQPRSRPQHHSFTHSLDQMCVKHILSKSHGVLSGKMPGAASFTGLADRD